MDTMTLDQARQVLSAQPFSALLGARITAFGDGRAVLELDVRDELRQQHGLVHGGVLAYLADNALTFAAGSALGPDILTRGVTVDYLAPARDGALRATAQVDGSDGRRAACSVTIEEVGPDATTLCAAASGTAVRRRPVAPVGEGVAS